MPHTNVTSSFVTHHRSYHELRKKWDKCRDVLLGEDRIKQRKTLYLPMLKGQTEGDYQAYLDRSTFYGATYKTATALTGMATRKIPKMTGPDSFLEWATYQVDEFHNDMWEFATRVTGEKVAVGRVGILVDMPPLDSTRPDIPYLSLYRAEQIINWHYSIEGDQLVMVLLEEAKEELLANNNTELIDYHRMLWVDPELGVQSQMFRKGQPVGEQVTLIRQGEPLTRLPFFFVDYDDNPDKPPLYDIVNLNVRHYRLYADYAHLLHYAAMPTLVISGVSDATQEIPIGSEKALLLSNPEARAEWIKAGSDGAQPIKSELDELENRMAAIGAQILQDRVDRETAQASQLRHSYNTAFLVLLTQQISDVLTKAARFAMWWDGMNEEDVKTIHVHLDSDFISAKLPAAELQILIQAYNEGSLSLDTLIYNLEKGEYLDPEEDPEEEKKRIEAMPAKEANVDVQIRSRGGTPSNPPGQSGGQSSGNAE
jgi:hypothetical protein